MVPRNSVTGMVKQSLRNGKWYLYDGEVDGTA